VSAFRSMTWHRPLIARLPQQLLVTELETDRALAASITTDDSATR
jgi:hypothetical protein